MHSIEKDGEAMVRTSQEKDGDGKAIHLEHGDEVLDVNEEEWSEKEVQRILWKIDIRLVPWLAWLYLMSYLDRGNIGNAKVAGLTKDLDMHGMQYNIAVMVFFFPYALLAIPCNIILKLMKGNVWMTIILVAWGVVMTLMGVVQNYDGLVAARFFLGFTESGFFPGASYILTLFYKRHEITKRMAIFYTCSALAGSFSGLLAFAIQKMDGIGGLEGWRWIFILEGLLPIATAPFLWIYFPCDPRSCRFLTDAEKNFIIRRLEHETGSNRGRVTNDDRIQASHVWSSLKQWKVYAGAIMVWGNSISVYGFTYTVPSVILGLGYSAANAQLLTIPVYFVAAIFVILWAYLSDHYRVRAWFIVGGYFGGVLGMIALIAIPQPRLPGLTYGFLFLAAAGMYCPFQVIMSWMANNMAPSSKRAVALAQILMCGNLGGIAGSNIYLEREAPQYWTGYGFSLAVLCTAIMMTFFMRWNFDRLNKKRDLMTEEEIQAKYTDEELLALGDRSPYFRYAL